MKAQRKTDNARAAEAVSPARRKPRRRGRRLLLMTTVFAVAAAGAAAMKRRREAADEWQSVPTPTTTDRQPTAVTTPAASRPVSRGPVPAAPTVPETAPAPTPAAPELRVEETPATIEVPDQAEVPTSTISREALVRAQQQASQVADPVQESPEQLQQIETEQVEAASRHRKS